MSLRIYDVPREMVTDFWSAIEPMIVKALKHHPHLDAPGLLRILNADYARLFLMTDGGKIIAACVMERVQYPSKIVANVVAFAGEYGVFHSHIDAVQSHMEAWARSRGCDTIGFVGRPGWTRFVRRKGGQLLPLVHAWRRLEG